MTPRLGALRDHLLARLYGVKDVSQLVASNGSVPLERWRRSLGDNHHPGPVRPLHAGRCQWFHLHPSPSTPTQTAAEPDKDTLYTSRAGGNSVDPAARPGKCSPASARRPASRTPALTQMASLAFPKTSRWSPRPAASTPPAGGAAGVKTASTCSMRPSHATDRHCRLLHRSNRPQPHLPGEYRPQRPAGDPLPLRCFDRRQRLDLHPRRPCSAPRTTPKRWRRRSPPALSASTPTPPTTCGSPPGANSPTR